MPLFIFLASICYFFFLKIPYFAWRTSDGHGYLYMGKLLFEGYLPYKDFFFAHPPFHIVMMGLLFKLVGTNIYGIHLASLFLHVANAYFLIEISKKYLSKTISFLLGTLYLCTFAVIVTTDYLTGIHLTMFLVLFGIYLHQAEKRALSNVLFVLAGLTRFYSIPIVFSFFLGKFLVDKKIKSGIVYGFTLVGCLALISLIAPAHFYHQVFLYHFQKLEGIPKADILKFFIKNDPFLIMGYLSLIVLFLKKDLNFLCFIIPLFLQSIFLLLFKDIYYFYLLTVVPFLLLGLGYVVNSFLFRFKSVVFGFLIMAQIIYSTYIYRDGFVNYTRFPAKEVSDYLKVNSSPSDTIYGRFEYTPLIALMSDHYIVGNFVDTNLKVFLTGQVSLESRMQELLHQHVSFIITPVLINQNKIEGIDYYVTEAYLREHCTDVKIFPLEFIPESNGLMIWKCHY